MKKDEAIKVLEILSHADTGCPYCVSSLFKEFIDTFPEYEDIARKKFKELFEDEIETFLRIVKV